MSLAQPVLWLLWAVLPAGRVFDVAKLAAFAGTLAGTGWLSWRGYLPRTRPIVPGEPVALD